MSNQTVTPVEEALAEIGLTRVDVKIAPQSLAKVLEEIAPEGVPVKVEEILGQDIVLHRIRFNTGEYGLYAFVIFTDENGELFNTIIGQQLLLPKLAAVRDRLPLSTKIVFREGGAHGGYYDFAKEDE